jgi:hypothetical protein
LPAASKKPPVANGWKAGERHVVPAEEGAQMSSFRTVKAVPALVKRLLTHLMYGLAATGLGMCTARAPDDEGIEDSVARRTESGTSSTLAAPSGTRPAQTVPVRALTRDELLWEAELAGGDTAF